VTARPAPTDIIVTTKTNPAMATGRSDMAYPNSAPRRARPVCRGTIAGVLRLLTSYSVPSARPAEYGADQPTQGYG
jgi:hypothetical protein